MTSEMSLVTFGMTAKAIEDAEHASFYGIHGDNSACYLARRMCFDAIDKFIAENNIEYNFYSIVSAHAIDTTGEKTPYKAEITFKIG